MKKVAVCQRFFPHYRVPFYQELASRFFKSGYELRLFYSLTIGKPPLQNWAKKLIALKKQLQLGELTETAVFAPTLFFHLMRYRPDIVVVEDISGLPNSLVEAFYCYLFRKPYLVWGLGSVPGKSPSKLRRWFAPCIYTLYSGAAGFICYSNHARSIYEQYQKPTFIVQNVCLPRPSDLEVESIKQAILEKYKESKLSLISIGMLSKQKRYEVLLNAIAELSNQDIELHLIGTGPERENLNRLCCNFGISKQVVFHGSLYTTAEKWNLLEKSHLGVLPGRGGLAIQEMMARGLPVVCGVADGTEKDMVKDGENGYLIGGFPSTQDLADRLLKFSQLSIESKQAMAYSALETVMTDFNIQRMVAGFENAVSTTVDRIAIEMGNE